MKVFASILVKNLASNMINKTVGFAISPNIYKKSFYNMSMMKANHSTSNSHSKNNFKID